MGKKSVRLRLGREKQFTNLSLETRSADTGKSKECRLIVLFSCILEQSSHFKTFEVIHIDIKNKEERLET